LKSRNSRAREAGFESASVSSYTIRMIDKPKRPRDPNKLAKFVLDVATGEATDAMDAVKEEGQQSGGMTGEERRAEKLSDDRHCDIARVTAPSRWDSKKSAKDE
jgi:hypothetical protein